MLESLTIKGFRGHRERVLRKLARVNLLVGPNNSGKTAILDAVEVLVRDGHPRTLASLAGRRAGEYTSAYDYREGDSLPAAVRYLFHGYGDSGHALFELGSEGKPSRRLSVSWEDRSEEGVYPGAAELRVLRDGGREEEVLGAGAHERLRERISTFCAEHGIELDLRWVKGHQKTNTTRGVEGRREAGGLEEAEARPEAARAPVIRSAKNALRRAPDCVFYGPPWSKGRPAPSVLGMIMRASGHRCHRVHLTSAQRLQAGRGRAPARRRGGLLEWIREG